jgi:AraC-like DNA-binding protein
VYFDCPIQFGARRSALVFDASMLTLGIAGADPMLYSAVLQRANMALSELKGSRGLVNEVSSYVVAHLHERPRMAQVAQALGFNERTLRRHLNELGVDFQALLQRFQLERARALLAQGERSIQQIAGDVGFASVSAFHRAFLRWTGDTPKAWREAIPAPRASALEFRDDSSQA